MEGLTEESLLAKIDALEQKMADLEKRNERPKPAEFVIQKYELNDNEKKILRLVSAGLPDAEAQRIAGLAPKYISQRVRQSVQFAAAYNELAEAYDRWLETQLKFVMPMTWMRIEDLLATDATAFLEEHPAFARNIIQAQTKMTQQLLRLNYAKEHKITVHNKVDQALLQVQEENAHLIAAALRDFSAKAAQGTLKEMLPENQIIDLVPKDIAETVYIENPMDDFGRLKCLICDEYVQDLAAHLHQYHDMAYTTYLRAYNIEPGKMMYGA